MKICKAKVETVEMDRAIVRIPLIIKLSSMTKLFTSILALEINNTIELQKERQGFKRTDPPLIFRLRQIFEKTLVSKPC